MSYESDFYAWAMEQAAALRRAAALPGVDLPHLAEEIEGLGSETLAEIEGLVVQIIAHLLKLEHCPDADPRRHWHGEVTAWRKAVCRRAKRSPSALGRLDVAELYRDAVAELTAEYGDRPWGADLSAGCPYTVAQLLAADWCPAEWRAPDDDVGYMLEGPPGKLPLGYRDGFAFAFNDPDFAVPPAEPSRWRVPRVAARTAKRRRLRG